MALENLEEEFRGFMSQLEHTPDVSNEDNENCPKGAQFRKSHQRCHQSLG